jgi:hypothetical protein
VDTSQGLIWAALVELGATVSCAIREDGSVSWRTGIPSAEERVACGGSFLLRVQGHRCVGRHRGETVFASRLSVEAVDMIRDQVGPLLCSASCTGSAQGRCSGLSLHAAVARGLSKGMFSSAGACYCRDSLTTWKQCAACVDSCGRQVRWWYRDVAGVT